jgi:uncharacterized delta-60 repeat protein
MIRRPVAIASLLSLLVPMARPAFAAAGDLDSTYGTGGLVRTDFTPHGDFAIGMAIQADDKVVAVGDAGGTNPKFAVARYNTDGTLDTSFSTDGKVLTDFGPNADEAVEVAIQGDGKIVVVGGVNVNHLDSRFGVVRYNPDGTLDSSFGVGGKVITNISPKLEDATGVAIQGDGKIVVGGGAGGGGNPDFALVRYNPDGSLDNAFGTGGIVRTDFVAGSNDWIFGGIQIQPDGKIVAGGYSNIGIKGNVRFAMARYNTDGTLDTSFSGDGKVATDFTGGFDYISWMAIQPDGKIVASGESGLLTTNDRAALARYNTDGTLDTSFNGSGKVTTDYGPHGDGAFGVAIQGDGMIVTAGARGLGGPNPMFAVCRYNPDGTLDTTFGGGDGKVFTDFGPFADFAEIVGIQSDGKIVAVGGSGQGSGNAKFAVARYLAA